MPTSAKTSLGRVGKRVLENRIDRVVVSLDDVWTWRVTVMRDRCQMIGCAPRNRQQLNGLENKCQWHRNRGFRWFSKPRPPSSWGHRATIALRCVTKTSEMIHLHSEHTIYFPYQERSSENTKNNKTLGGWGFTTDPTVGAYSAPSDPLAGGKGAQLVGRGLADVQQTMGTASSQN